MGWWSSYWFGHFFGHIELMPDEGNYIAVWNRTVVAFGSDLVELRERLKQLTGIDPARVTIARVEKSIASDQPTPEEVTQRTYEDLARELIELEKQFPLPERGDAIPDAKWFEEHWGKPALTQYGGSFVAVLNGAVVGHGLNSLQLQIDVARKCNVHPQRFIIEYVPPSNF